MKSLLENGKKIIKDWNNINKDTLSRYINDCIKTENVIIQIDELFKKKKIDNYELKMLSCQNEIDDLDTSFINELKLNTDFVDKLINNYFSYNTIEYELIDNISMGKDVFLLSDDKNRKRFQYKAFNQLNNTNCEMYINSKKFEFSKYIKINEKNKYISIIYKIINNFKFADTSCMFYECYDLKKIKFHNLDTSELKAMGGMFRCYVNLESIEGIDN